jgi:hypothetical protein
VSTKLELAETREREIIIQKTLSKTTSAASVH